MTKTITLSLSLGSGPAAEELASKIKSWAAGKPISEAIRNLILRELAGTHQIIQK
jgi:hypothetical protein